MRFSIIVPVYNAAKYLKDCVRSVTSQPFCDWELLLVDDGSTDGSETLVDELAAQDGRIRAFHQANTGQFFARQTGIHAAHGEYLLFLDSDDRFAGSALSAVDASIGRNEWDMVLFLGRAFGPGIAQDNSIGDIYAAAGEIELETVRRVVASSSRLNAVWLKAFKRGLFANDATDYRSLRDVRHGEDKAMLLYPLTRARHCCYLPQVLYLYRKHPTSIMSSLALKDIPSLLGNAVFSLTRRAMGKWGLTSDADMRALGAYYLRNYIATYFNLRHACTSRQDRRALRRYPWKGALDQQYLKLEYARELSPRDRCRLACARLRV